MSMKETGFVNELHSLDVSFKFSFLHFSSFFFLISWLAMWLICLLISHVVYGTWLICICKWNLICIPRTFSTWGVAPLSCPCSPFLLPPHAHTYLFQEHSFVDDASVSLSRADSTAPLTEEREEVIAKLSRMHSTDSDSNNKAILNIWHVISIAIDRILFILFILVSIIIVIMAFIGWGHF